MRWLTSRAKARLTPKQLNFASYVAAGASLAEAYRLSYDSYGGPNTVRVEACRLAQKPHIRTAIDRIRLTESYRALNKASRQELCDELHFGATEHHQLRAAMVLARMLSL